MILKMSQPILVLHRDPLRSVCSLKNDVVNLLQVSARESVVVELDGPQDSRQVHAESAQGVKAAPVSPTTRIIMYLHQLAMSSSHRIFIWPYRSVSLPWC